MADNFFRGPGEKEIQKLSIRSGKNPDAPQGSADSSLVKSKGGGLRKATQDTVAARQQAEALKNPEPAPEALEIPTLDLPRKEDEPKEDPAVLSDPKWIDPDTLFQQEADVSVQVTLPKTKKSITKVQVELFVKTQAGPESVCKAEGHAQADGTAVVTLPVYKPKNHDGGPAEYYFEVTHKFAKMLSTIGIGRTITETALKSTDHALIPGIVFQKDTSFITPKAADGLKQVDGKLKEWDKQDPKKTKIAVFGHTAKDEKDAKGLSERRAQSAFAFITNDAGAWDKIYGAEKWGMKPLQTILKDLAHYQGTEDGQAGPKTQAAFKAFQKKSGLPETGQGDATTRKALFTAYMKGKHDIQIDASRFRKVADNPWMGCGANNRAKGSDGVGPENRRVTFALLKESKYFPVYFPCRDGYETACQGQGKKAGKRSEAGIKCLFYDELVREMPQTTAEAPPETAAETKKDEGIYSIEKAVAHIDANALDESQGRCARYVRLAIYAGGGKIKPPNPMSAKDYGPKLLEIGFKKSRPLELRPRKRRRCCFSGAFN
ncbi:MAG: peptidoglycan-binding protein [Fibrobacterota bacterium]|nr:peptidoglycan-binding protein [Fibrobacterota bacterium]